MSVHIDFDSVAPDPRPVQDSWQWKRLTELLIIAQRRKWELAARQREEQR